MATEVNDMKASLKNVEEIFQNTEQTPLFVGADNRVDILELALEELRIIYGRLDDSLATVKLRILTFLGAGMALLSYLYSGNDLFIPDETYGKVFYFLGLGLVVSAIGFLLRGLRTMSWSVPIESKLTKIHTHKTKAEALDALVEEYIECMVANIARYENKVTHLNSGFFQLLCGGTLLLVIKSIGG